MFDVLTEQTDTNNSNQWVSSADIITADVVTPVTVRDEPTFRTIKVLLIETGDAAGAIPIVEQCLRYMPCFECEITQAGTHAAAAFALSADTFDVVITDENCLDLIKSAGQASALVITGRSVSGVTRIARMAGALHCLALNDLSPRLLETAISQALRGEQSMA
jgi:hypothetical protein